MAFVTLLISLKLLFQEFVKTLRDNPKIRKEDIFVSIVQNGPENRSFGNGMAQRIET